MTTVLYKPDEFAACDSVWSIDGYPVHWIREQKFILFPAKSDGAMHLAMMCGSHIAIALQQAHLLQLITSNQYATLQTLYLAEFDMEIDTAIFNLSTGQLRCAPHTYYPINKYGGSHSMGTGGNHASHFYYHSPRWLLKKRRKNPLPTFQHSCLITGSLACAYSHDSASGGKMNRIEWKDGVCIFSNISLVAEDYLHNYSSDLKLTMQEIDDMYQNQKNSAPQARLTQDQNNLQDEQVNKVKITASAVPEATKLTMSRVLDHIKLFESL